MSSNGSVEKKQRRRRRKRPRPYSGKSERLQKALHKLTEEKNDIEAQLSLTNEALKKEVYSCNPHARLK